MLLSYLSVLFVIILKINQNVDGLICDKCEHSEAFSSSAQINSNLRSSGLIKTDTNCKQFNSNYVTGITESCNTICVLHATNLNATIQGHSLSLVTAARGCAPIDDFDSTIHSVDTCQDLSRNIEDYYKSLGYSSVTAASLECYCNEDNCNGRNVSAADNSKMTGYLNTGHRMTSPSVILMCWIFMMGFVTKNN